MCVCELLSRVRLFATAMDFKPARLLCPDKDTGVGCHFLLQGIFPTRGSNRHLLHCRPILYQLSYEGSPKSTIVQLEKKKTNQKNQLDLEEIEKLGLFLYLDILAIRALKGKQSYVFVT